MRGSEHNDPFVQKGSRLGTASNNSGGIQGGISNGEPIVFRVAFKPAATIGQSQTTANFAGEPDVMAAKGRHDPCVVPRAVAIVEAMAALVLADSALAQLARLGAAPLPLAPGVSGAVDTIPPAQLAKDLARETRLREAYEARVQQLVRAHRERPLMSMERMGPLVLGALVGLACARLAAVRN